VRNDSLDIAAELALRARARYLESRESRTGSSSRFTSTDISGMESEQSSIIGIFGIAGYQSRAMHYTR
jgi:hypothetical protein